MIERISTDEAKRRLDDGWIYLDVRTVPEFEQGHPTGAYNVPLMHMGPAGMAPNPEFIHVVQARFPKDQRVVIGCRSGGRSLRAAEMMKAAGYADVAEQRSGFAGARDPFGQLLEKGWEAAGLPTAAAAEPGRSWEELSRPT
jgi:rhodanese-related sulfurtransferase